MSTVQAQYVVVVVADGIASISHVFICLVKDACSG